MSARGEVPKQPFPNLVFSQANSISMKLMYCEFVILSNMRAKQAQAEEGNIYFGEFVRIRGSDSFKLAGEKKV